MIEPGSEEILRRLDIEADECAVLSILLVERGSAFSLVQGSLLFGPAPMGAGNWTQWEALHDVQGPKLREPDGALYCLRAGKMMLARVPLEIDTASEWLKDLLSTGTASATDDLPAVRADLRSAPSPIMVSPRGGTMASEHAVRSVRSSDGVLYSLDAVPMDPAVFPMEWHPDGGGDESYFGTGGLLAGLFWPLDSIEVPNPGLLVARVRRRAWIVEPRGTPDWTIYDLKIGLDPTRIDVSDLEVQIEESVSGEIVHGRRLRLEEMGADDTRGHSLLTIKLPTLGRGVQRRIRLYERNGELLDFTENVYSVEGVSISVHAMGEVPVPGLKPAARALDFGDRVAALARVQDDYAKWAKRGTGQLVFGPTDDLRPTLAGRLRQARDRLLVADRYFSDWALLDGIAIPKRVLMSQGDPPTNAPSDLEVRWLRGSPPSLHGRYYLWDRGGLFVDNSPEGFEKGFTTIQGMNRFTSERLTEIFDSTWWPNAKLHPPQPQVVPSTVRRWLRRAQKGARPLTKRLRHARNKVVGRSRGFICRHWH